MDTCPAGTFPAGEDLAGTAFHLVAGSLEEDTLGCSSGYTAAAEQIRSNRCLRRLRGPHRSGLVEVAEDRRGARCPVRRSRYCQYTTMVLVLEFYWWGRHIRIWTWCSRVM